ncbi:MAG: amino acid permease [Chlamydiales bacterium]|nr:amino acid permease [Chlamydiales bacterium]
MNPQKKMGFWAVTSLVAGSQIGTGIFLLPSSMAPFGAAGLSSWLITATGAMLLAFVFARLSANIPKAGGPHAFIESAFGRTFGFFSAWTYWVISWLSTPMVVISVVTYLTPVLGELSPLVHLAVELTILFFITGLNLLGVRSAGRVEFVFTVLKLLPLLLVPLGGLFFLNKSHFIPFNPTSDSTIGVMNAAALLTLWGFIGVESATAPVEAVDNPRKTVPRAIIVGTLIVALVYIFSSIVIMGVVPADRLAESKAPFADAAQIIFGGNWYMVISIAASIVCLGTLNAWMLTSGQIALGAAYDGHLPRFFSRTNASGAPKWGLLISSLGMIPVLLATMNRDLVSQVHLMIDVSVTAFLFIYTLSILSYLKLFWKNRQTGSLSMGTLALGGSALLFCGWALYSSGLKMVALASLIALAGLPVYWRKSRRRSEEKSLSPN